MTLGFLKNNVTVSVKGLVLTKGLVHVFWDKIKYILVNFLTLVNSKFSMYPSLIIQE